MSESPIVQPEKPDEELHAYHEAGHAVAMWVIGAGVKVVSIEPKGGLFGFAEPARRYPPPLRDTAHARRFIIEQAALYIHAGDVAARLFRPSVGVGQARIDHETLHQMMSGVEDSGTVQITWCNHLWQRSYELLHWPGNWFLVIGLAQQLLKYRTIHEAEATRYLHIATARLEHDPWMPNAYFAGDIKHVCSPWHREWYERSMTATAQPKRVDVPSSIEGLSARMDVRPIMWALTPLSKRAQNFLRRCGVRTVADLEVWNECSFRRMRGGGPKTVEEIIAAAARARIRMAPARP